MKIIFVAYRSGSMRTSNRRVAIIDMGTNTFHLLIADISAERSFEILINEKIAVKIGKEGISKGLISEEAMDRGLAALKQFKKIIRDHDVQAEEAYATSALRSAANSKDFLERIFSETGLSPKVINGNEEAEFIYFGVKTALHLSDNPNLIVDIGGGSIEFIIADRHKIFWRESHEIGAQRLKDKFHGSDPITKKELSALESFLDEKLMSLISALKKYKPDTLIGVAGSFDTLMEIFELRTNKEIDPQLKEGSLPIEDFEVIRKDLTAKTLEERLKTPGLVEFRAEMIVVALAVIHWVMQKNNFIKIRNSRYSLKEGVLYSMIKNQT